VQWPFPPATYIDHDDDFRKLVAVLTNEPLIALDTESNSLHVYRERVCLVQISTRKADYIIDPFRVANLELLGPILADSRIEKVFHAAEYDMLCLKRDYGFVVHNLFDTMIAARICGHKEMGLNKLLAEYCGVTIAKNHQRDDWGKRPLPEEGLLYAQIDTHYLPMLRDHLYAQLAKLGRLAEAQEILSEYSEVPLIQREFDPEGFWRIGFPAGLSRRQMAILRELYLLREQLAQERDCPPFKVFGDQVLIALAEAAPPSLNAMAHTKGVAASYVERHGTAILEAIERGRHAPKPSAPPRPPDASEEVIERFTALRDWRKLRAEQRGVESDVIVSKDALWGIALKMPKTLDEMSQIRGLGPWRIRTYGAEILDMLKPYINGD
jgi:ribonuclease D